MCPSDFLFDRAAVDDDHAATTQTLEYLRLLGFGDNPLTNARAAVKADRETPFVFEPEGVNYCDFCFTKLTGVEYDLLADGRDRCVRCSRSVVRTHADFAELVEEVRTSMELAFGIRLRASVQLRMVNAAQIARRTGETFAPTPGVDPRVLGFAQKTRRGYRLFVENGAPKLAATGTLAHEFTHIWQFVNWDRPGRRRSDVTRRLIVREGMASWVEIQYLYFIREFGYARRQEEYTRRRQDEYGEGFRLFDARYPIDRDGDTWGDTPFKHALPL